MHFNNVMVIFEILSSGLTLRIEVSKEMRNLTSGLCGRFNLNNNDDKIGSDGLGKDSLSKLAESWNEDEDCKVSENQSGSTCKIVSF